MRRGEIYYAELGPTVGREINKRRPVLVVSCDANNRAASTITVLPITSNVSRIYPFEVALPPTDSGLPNPSKAQAQPTVHPGLQVVASGQHLDLHATFGAAHEGHLELGAVHRLATRIVSPGDLVRDVSNAAATVGLLFQRQDFFSGDVDEVAGRAL